MTSQAPFEVIRGLTAAIDPAIQDLLEAHGFAFRQLAAGAAGATASFAATMEDRTWRLDIERGPDGAHRLDLHTEEQPAPVIALRIALDPMTGDERGDGPTAGMAGAVALAMSLVATTASLRVPNQADRLRQPM